MKNQTLTMAFAILIAGCTTQVDLSKEIPGAYSLTEQDIQQGEKTNSYKDLKQLKIYTTSHFMYTQINPSDSTSSFGVGSYDTNGDTLTEHVMYSSSDSTFSDQPVSYNLAIKITPEGYNQVINGIVIEKVSSKLTELYNRVKNKETSPLDGVWKEQKSYLIIGSDTTYNKRTQYKSFYNGYFMFGNTASDSLRKTTTNMGYGTFEMISDKQFKETDLNSSYPFVAGNTFTIDLIKPDEDHFQQTITNSDGSKSVEFYERVK